MAAQAAVTDPAVVTPPPPAADPAKPAEPVVAKPAEGAAPPADPAKPADKGGDKPLEFKAPEGVVLDDKAIEAYRSAFKDWGIKDPEVAAKIVAADAARLQATQKGEADAWAAQDGKWRADLEADKDFGGSPENIAKSDAAIARARTLFPDQWNALAADLKNFKLENLPSLSKFMRALGLANAEDSAANPGGGAGAGPKSRDEVFNQFNKNPERASA
jgi:hypothetical protein